MKYRFWIFQDSPPPGARPGNPEAPGPGDPILSSLRHPGREAEGIAPAVDQIMQVFASHGVSDENEITVIRGKVTEALMRGSYRTALPTPGRWLLAERVGER